MTFTNKDDVIDSRDVIARIEELEDELKDGAINEDTSMFEIDGEDFDPEYNELEALKSLAEEASGYAPDWEYGESLIRDSYFKEYAQELAEDCGMIVADATWPNNCIDWEEAARQLQQDYTSVDFDGVEYWIR